MSASKRILVVDDSEICRELVRNVLTARGYEVVVLDSPFGFGAALARESPDLVLVDASMPALHGGKLVEVALQNGLCRCPIVFHSDRPPRELQSLVLSTGASGFIQKTSDPEELWARVEEYLSGAWRNRERAPDSMRSSSFPPPVSSPGRSDAAPVSRRVPDLPPLSQRPIDLPPVSQRNPDAPPPSQRTITSPTGWVRGKF
jgi:DNA-binding response OmpR family regulator